MTKTVRVENADTASFKVIVEVYDRVGDAPDPKVDTLARTINLDYPTAMTDASTCITSHRYLVVKEA